MKKRDLIYDHTLGPSHLAAHRIIALLNDRESAARSYGQEVDGIAAIIDEETAAPELLERLIIALEWLADEGVPADHPEAVKIRAAIAKAESSINE